MTIHAFRRRATWHAAAAAPLVIALAACDLTVTNPGPVQSDFLTDPNAIPALVNGAGRNLAEALNWTSYTGGAVAREIHPAGSTGSFGITVDQQNGSLQDDEVDTHWNLSQQARWTAEDAVRKLENTLGSEASSSPYVAQALVWVGFSNRHLGENFCDAVFDGGPREDYTAYLDRAEAAFTQAMTVAAAADEADLVTAARAGRASVRLLKANYTEAVADAAGIPNDFVYAMPYFSIDLDQTNRIFWAGANTPYRAHTVWHTQFEPYYLATEDPRVEWTDTGLTGDAAVGTLGRVPFYLQKKYTERTSSINLVSGWEMRLIEAEAKLAAGDVQGALAPLNAHRVALGLTPWAPANEAEAWGALKMERGIELWLESRRLGDLRRWAAQSRPGETGQPANFDLCFPLSRSEKETNPNLQ